MPTVTVDLVTHSPSKDAYVLVLVEEGPWPPAARPAALRRLQDRLYSAVDIILDGAVCQRFPDSRGKAFTIRVDCYDIPRRAVLPFLHRFEAFIRRSPEYQRELSCSPYVAGLSFDFSAASLRSRLRRGKAPEPFH